MPDYSATIDDVREYWNRRPCNVRHSDLAIGSKEYFDAVEARKYRVEPHIPAFAGFERWRGKRVLEIGCGIGTDAANFARHGAHYVGVELSEVSLELAKRRFEVLDLPGEFFVGDVEHLTESDVPEGPYDLIYSFGVLHHTPDIARALSELRNFSGNGTELRVMLYARNSWKAFMIEEGLDQPEAQDGCPIALTFTRESAKKLFVEAGFEVTQVWQDHIFPFNVEHYVNYEYVFEPWFREMPAHLFQVLEKRLGWHLLVTAQLGQ